MMTKNDKENLSIAIMLLVIAGIIMLFYVKNTTETPDIKKYRSAEIRRFEYPEDGVVCYAYDDFKVGSISCVVVKDKTDAKK